MAGKYQTMELVAKISQDERYFQGVYQCKVCHGVLIDRGLDSLVGPPANDDSQIANWACPLCDASVPLSRRYRMALCTVGWRCRVSGISTVTAPLGFPSFDNVYIGYRRDYITLVFNYKGTSISASADSISTLRQDQTDLFDAMLDDRPDLPTLINHEDMRSLARVVVQRCLNDMNLEQAREEA